MSKYDHGGGCPCGLYKTCECDAASPVDTSVDFGFSDIDTFPAMIQKNPVDNRAEELYDCIDTLLIKLEENPESEFIRWPNRLESIQRFREKLQKIITKRDS